MSESKEISFSKFPDWIIDASRSLRKQGITCVDYSKFHTMGEESVYSCLMPTQIQEVQKILKDILNSAAVTPITAKLTCIIDGNAHIGCDTFHFAKLFPTIDIFAVEKHDITFQCLERNVARLELEQECKNVKVIQGDIQDIILKIGSPKSLLFLDPPWGGREYIKSSEVPLFISDEPVAIFIRKIFELELTGLVILKAPLNFSYEKFQKSISESAKAAEAKAGNVSKDTNHKVKLSTLLYPVKHPPSKNNNKTVFYNLISILKEKEPPKEPTVPLTSS